MSDIVERLRTTDGRIIYGKAIWDLLGEAADEIERLRGQAAYLIEQSERDYQEFLGKIERLRGEIHEYKTALEQAIREASQHDSDEACLQAEIERLRAELEIQRDSQISAVNQMLAAEQEIERLRSEVERFRAEQIGGMFR